MLEIYDNLMLNPQAERAMEYFYMEKNYAAFYAELDVLVGAPEGEFSKELASCFVNLRPDELVAGVTYLLRGPMMEIACTEDEHKSV